MQQSTVIGSYTEHRSAMFPMALLRIYLALCSLFSSYVVAATESPDEQCKALFQTALDKAKETFDAKEQTLQRLWFDVGLRRTSELRETLEFWEKYAENLDGVFVIGFEPRPEPGEVPYGQHPQFTFLPIGLSNENAMKTFHLNLGKQQMNSFHGASKNMARVFHAKMENNDAVAQNQYVDRQQLVCKLETLVEMIPASVRLEVLVTDAQGHDLAVLQGLGEEGLRRIEHVFVETQDVDVSNPDRRMAINESLFTDGATLFDVHKVSSEHGLTFQYCERYKPTHHAGLCKVGLHSYGRGVEMNCYYSRDQTPDRCIREKHMWKIEWNRHLSQDPCHPHFTHHRKAHPNMMGLCIFTQYATKYPGFDFTAHGQRRVKCPCAAASPQLLPAAPAPAP